MPGNEIPRGPRTCVGKVIQYSNRCARRSCECPALCFPAKRKSVAQCRDGHSFRLPAIQNSFNNVRCQQRQPEEATDIAVIDALGPCQVGDRCVRALLQHFPPSEPPGNRLDHRVVGLLTEQLAGIANRPFRRQHDLPPSSLADRNRHPHCDGAAIALYVWLRHQAALFASGRTAASSSVKPVNPSVRSRISTPSGLTSTRSMRSWTTRACSAGNNSSQIGSSRCSASRNICLIETGNQAAPCPPCPNDHFRCA